MALRTIDIDEAPTAVRARPRRRTVMVGAVAALVVGVGVGVLVTAGPTPQPQPAPAATDPGLTPTAGEVPGVPGLHQGTATVTWGNGDALYGVPIAWPRDTDGAIGAAMNYTAANWDLANLLPDTRAELAEARFADDGKASAWDDATAARIRGYHGIDEQGNLPDGTTLHLEAYPQFGAYRVRNIEHADDGQPVEIDVDVWYPAVEGISTTDDLSGVQVRWLAQGVGMRWEEGAGDWQIYAIGRPQSDPLIPFDTDRTNQRNVDKRAILGEGWAIPADATENGFPGAVKTK